MANEYPAFHSCFVVSTGSKLSHSVFTARFLFGVLTLVSLHFATLCIRARLSSPFTPFLLLYSSVLYNCLALPFLTVCVLS